MSNDSKYVRLYPERAVAPVRAALEECKRLAIDHIRAADAAVKADVYAADALMGIAKTCLDALAGLDQLGFPKNEPLFLLRGQDILAPASRSGLCRPDRSDGGSLRRYG